MEDTIHVLNEMVREKVLESYAIGGAVALLFYTEPANTYDLDIFCVLPPTTSPLITLKPLYDWLRSRGFAEDKEHVMINGIPVQFIPAYNDLLNEAVAQAQAKGFKSAKTRVVQLEHLLAIMIQTGRTKDRLRAIQVKEEAALDSTKLAAILDRYALASRWQVWQSDI